MSNFEFIRVNGRAFTEPEARAAIEYALKRGVLHITTPNPELPDTPRIELPRGEAGDEFNRLQKRVAWLEEHLADIMQRVYALELR